MIIRFYIVLAVMLAAFESLAGFPVPPATGPNDAMPRAAFHYPAFSIPLDDGYYTEVELKASENNFTPSGFLVTVLGEDPIMVFHKSTASGIGVFESGVPADPIYATITYLTGDSWKLTYRSEYVTTWGILTGPAGFRPPDGVTDNGIPVEYVEQFCYYYDSFRPSVFYSYDTIKHADLNAHCYYTISSNSNPYPSYLLAATENLSDVAGPDNAQKFVTIYPSRATGPDATPSEWMHPYNSNLTWIFSRRHPITGKEVDSSGKFIWHRIEPTAWLPFQK